MRKAIKFEVNHPCCCPFERTTRVLTVPTEMKKKEIKLKGRSFFSFSTSSKKIKERRTRKIPTGTFMKKTQFQPRCSVSHPPKVGPTAGAKLAPSPKIPIATPLCSGG